MSYVSFMEQALEQARAAMVRGEVPVGAVLVDADGMVIAADGNRMEEYGDPVAHAEMLVIRTGVKKFDTPRLVGCDLYVSLEPCPMCAHAISLARIRRLYFGATDVKGGGVENGACLYTQPTCHHKPEVYSGICDIASSELLKSFFVSRRDRNTSA